MTITIVHVLLWVAALFATAAILAYRIEDKGVGDTLAIFRARRDGRKL